MCPHARSLARSRARAPHPTQPTDDGAARHPVRSGRCCRPAVEPTRSIAVRADESLRAAGDIRNCPRDLCLCGTVRCPTGFYSLAPGSLLRKASTGLVRRASVWHAGVSHAPCEPFELVAQGARLRPLAVAGWSRCRNNPKVYHPEGLASAAASQAPIGTQTSVTTPEPTT